MMVIVMSLEKLLLHAFLIVRPLQEIDIISILSAFAYNYQCNDASMS